MHDTIRVLIADDHPLFREGMRGRLHRLADIEVVGEASSGHEAVELAQKLCPQVILMDIKMPGMNGIEATREILRASPQTGVLVLTMFEDDTSVFPAIRAGARGYLLKDTDQTELLRAIQTVAGGGVIFSAGIAQRVIQYLTAPQPPIAKQAFDELTQREGENLEMIARGRTNTEIAEQLQLSPKTVSNNISNVLLKVQVADRAKLMLLALDAGLGLSYES